MKKLLLILLCLPLLFTTCKKEETNTPTELIIDSYPISIGNEWRYKKSITHIVNNDTSLFNESRVVTIEKDSIINGIDVMKYRTTSIEYPQFYSASFKRQTSQGIYTHAYIGTLDASIHK